MVSWGESPKAKTSLEFPEDLFREFKGFCARHGLAMTEVIRRFVAVLLSATPEGEALRHMIFEEEGDGEGADVSELR